MSTALLFKPPASRRSEKGAPEAPSGSDDSLQHHIHRASQRATDLWTEHAEPAASGITRSQYTLLARLDSHAADARPLSQTDLVDVTGIDRSTLADILRRLNRKGLLQRRRRKDDARAYAVTLTEAGRKARRALAPVAERVEAKLEADPVLIALAKRLARKGRGS